jgi:hypothetical protein
LPVLPTVHKAVFPAGTPDSATLFFGLEALVSLPDILILLLNSQSI